VRSIGVLIDKERQGGFNEEEEIYEGIQGEDCS
jgi:hypothetical protein